MSDTPLFPDLPEQLSPRLAWMRKHGVITMSFAEHQRFGDDDKWAAAFAPGVVGKDAIAQRICDECSHNGEMTTGWGATEDEAMENLALKFRVPHWSLSP
jgi:hypothetical protein